MILKIYIIGLIVGVGRIFLQRKDLVKLTTFEKIQTTLVYCMGMMLLIGGGAFVMEWTTSLAIHELLKILVFLGVLSVLYVMIHVIVAMLLPKF